MKKYTKNTNRIKHIIFMLLTLFSALALSVNVAAADIGEYFTNPLFLAGIYILILMTLMFVAFIIVARKSRKASSDYEEKAAGSEADFSADSVKEESKKPEQERKSRFHMLSDIDDYMLREYKGTHFNDSIPLDKFCELFRNFAANKLNLYYDIGDIRSFISGMAVSHFILMQGMSGTGKTSLAYAFGQFVKNNSVIVPIQPMWKESSDMIGYYNEFTHRFNETNLLGALYKANYTDELYIIVLDEINISRVEYYFAEFLSLLELPNPEDRKIRIMSDKSDGDPRKLINGEIKIPTNVWFIGTANNDDSTFAISDKVYDRAMIVNLDKKAEIFDAPMANPMSISGDYFNRLAENASSEYSMTDRNRRRIAEFDRYLMKNFHIAFGNRIMRQMEKYVSVYIACGGKETDAIDDIVSKKILRKLESQNPVYVRNAIGGVYEFLDELFGKESMPRCREYLNRIEMSV